MKILHVIDSGGMYGAEVMLLSLMREQQHAGHQPILVSIGGNGVQEKPVEKEALRFALSVEKIRFANGPNLVGALRLLRFARKVEADLLHLHGYKCNILLGMLPRALRGVPLVTTVHGWTSCGRFSRMVIYKWIDKIFLKRIDRVVLVNPLMQTLHGLSDLKHATVVENGIQIEKIADESLNSEIIELIHQRPTIVAVGRLSPEKGFNLLIQAFKYLLDCGHDLQLLIFGEGGMRRPLTEQCRQLGLVQRVHLPGHVPHVQAYLPHCALFAMPSLTEGLPLALLEAMHARVPIVASRVGGIPSVLEGGKSGWLVSPGDIDSLLQALSEGLTDSFRVQQQVALAFDRVTNSYTSCAMAKCYMDVYQDVLAAKRTITQRSHNV